MLNHHFPPFTIARESNTEYFVLLLFNLYLLSNLIWNLCPAGVFGHDFQKAVCYLGGTGGESVSRERLTFCLPAQKVSAPVETLISAAVCGQARLQRALRLTFTRLLCVCLPPPCQEVIETTQKSVKTKLQNFVKE